MLRCFARDAARHVVEREGETSIRVIGGEDVHLSVDTVSQPLLPSEIVADIKRQVQTFFCSRDAFADFDVPHRRGLLFVGPPGNGKTMMVRSLVAQYVGEAGATAVQVAASRSVDEETIAYAAATATQEGPGILILEDLDTLVRETEVTRAGLLSLLDGLKPTSGLLILATTNNPEVIDPALVHRPSRFDRVWHFPLPSEELRAQYLAGVLKQCPKRTIRRLVEATGGWSFAYLAELRSTAAIIALQESRETIDEHDVLQSLELLASQFLAGKKNHTIEDTLGEAGFKVA